MKLVIFGAFMLAMSRKLSVDACSVHRKAVHALKLFVAEYHTAVSGESVGAGPTTETRVGKSGNFWSCKDRHHCARGEWV